jgi:hypothetical protein
MQTPPQRQNKKFECSLIDLIRAFRFLGKPQALSPELLTPDFYALISSLVSEPFTVRQILRMFEFRSSTGSNPWGSP